MGYIRFMFTIMLFILILIIQFAIYVYSTKIKELQNYRK